MYRGPFTPPSLYTPISAYTHPIIRPLPLSGQEGTFGEKWRGGRYKQGGRGRKRKEHCTHIIQRPAQPPRKLEQEKQNERGRSSVLPSVARSVWLVAGWAGGSAEGAIIRHSSSGSIRRGRREKMSSRDQIDNDATMYYVRNVR